ncbi:MAG: stage III sporulation protein AB [Eubacteriales bacterium]
MKTIAMLILFAACSLTGLYKSACLRYRCSELGAFLKGFERIDLELKHSPEQSSQILLRAFEASGRALFRAIAEKPNNAYDNIRDGLIQASWLTEKDWRIIDRFFVSFGKTDRKLQQELCGKTLAELEQQKKDADDKCSKTAGVWLRSGILAGAFAVVMFI